MTTTVLASIARILARLANARDIDGDALLRSAGLDPALTAHVDGRFAFDRIAAAWVEMAMRVDEPAIGLEAGQHYRPLDLQALGVAFLSSDTLLTALHRVDRYERLLNTRVDYTVVESADTVSIECGGLELEGFARRIFEDARTSIMLDMCRSGVDGLLNPVAVAFPYPAPADLSPYFGLFRCQPTFDAKISKLVFRGADARRPFTTANRELARSNDLVLDRMLRQLDTDDLESRVERAIIDALPSGLPSQRAVARQLNLSGRTLQRRLAAQATSFSDVRTRARRNLAQAYVADPHIPVAEISFMLGFSEVSAFTRAFKQWTGLPPATFRARHLGAGGQANGA